jgi:hypothetical protein
VQIPSLYTYTLVVAIVDVLHLLRLVVLFLGVDGCPNKGASSASADGVQEEGENHQQKQPNHANEGGEGTEEGQGETTTTAAEGADKEERAQEQERISSSMDVSADEVDATPESQSQSRPRAESLSADAVVAVEGQVLTQLACNSVSITQCVLYALRSAEPAVHSCPSNIGGCTASGAIPSLSTPTQEQRLSAHTQPRTCRLCSSHMLDPASMRGWMRFRSCEHDLCGQCLPLLRDLSERMYGSPDAQMQRLSVGMVSASVCERECVRVCTYVCVCVCACTYVSE